MKNTKSKTKLRLKMNKKHIVALIISVALLISATAILVSCNWLNEDDPVKDQLPEDIVSELKNIETQIQDSLQEVLNTAMSDEESLESFLVESESRTGFEVLSCTEIDTGFKVNIKVYSPDLYTVAKEIDENYTYETEEELKMAVAAAVKTAPIVEQDVTIDFRKTTNGYQPMLTMEFFNAYYGGVLKLLDEALAKIDKEAEQ